MKVLEIFCSNIISFLDELLEQFPNETELYLARHLLKDQLDPKIVVTTFIREILPYKEAVQKRDDDVFVNGKITILQGGSSNHFKKLWKSLGESDRQTIWEWFDLFIDLSEKYQKVVDSTLQRE